jgi:hypothetical protein
MENGRAENHSACHQRSSLSAFSGDIVRRLLVIILILMMASVVSILWIKPRVDSTHPIAPHGSATG